MTNGSYENQIFNWENWDQHDTCCFGFNNVELVIQVGEFPAGTKFSYATVDYEHSMLCLMGDDNIEHIFPLVASIGNKLSSKKVEFDEQL